MGIKKEETFLNFLEGCPRSSQNFLQEIKEGGAHWIGLKELRWIDERYNKEKGTTQQPHRFYVGQKKELCGKQSNKVYSYNEKRLI